MFKLATFIVLSAFVLQCLMPPQVMAQAAMNLPVPGTMVALSDGFSPARLQGMVVNPKEPFKFDFLISRGDMPLAPERKKAVYQDIIKYFLASLAVPEQDQWVNLSPYENNRIIEESFGMTEMGRDLLAQDYILKQLTASLMHPDEQLGRQFWGDVYARAQEVFGTTDIPLNTFNKVWIMPDEAVILEKDNTAVILSSHLKVMLEEDYVALRHDSSNRALGTDRLAQQDINEASRISSDVVRQVILPAIEKEVNEGKNFANLRQIVSGMILAAWFKKALKESILDKVYADQRKVKGIDQDPARNQVIYEQYVEAFRKGAFNLIREDVDRYSQELIPRKYFSGGFKADLAQSMKIVDRAQAPVDMSQTDRVPTAFIDAAERVGVTSGSLEDQMRAALDKTELGRSVRSATTEESVYSMIVADAQKLYDGYQRSVLNGLAPDQVAAIIEGKGGAELAGEFAGKAEINIFDNIQAFLLGIGSLQGDRIQPVMQSVLQALAEVSWKKTMDNYRNLELPVTQDTLSANGVLPLRWQIALALRNEDALPAGVVVGKAISIDATLFRKGGVLYEKPMMNEFGVPVSVQMLGSQGYGYRHVYEAEKDGAVIIVVSDGIFNPDTRKFEDSAQINVMKVSSALHDPKEGETYFKELVTINGTVKLLLSFLPEQKFLFHMHGLGGHANVGGKIGRTASGYLRMYLRQFRIDGQQTMEDVISRIYQDLKKDPNVDFAQGIGMPQTSQSDNSMYGGIDLDSANMNMQIKRDGSGMPLPVGQQDFGNIKIDGLVPVILDIRPAGALPALSAAATDAAPTV